MYEGYNNNQVSFISHISALLGWRFIILTNSIGGGIVGMKPGSIMISKDHINFTTEQPVSSCWSDKRFLSQHFKGTSCHSKYLNSLAKKIAEEKQIDLFEGVYCWCLGPWFETPMETTTLRAFGGGCFGMSTVPEILASGQTGMEWAIVSLVCNLAAGMQEKLTDTEVFDVAIRSGPVVGQFIKDIIAEIDLSTDIKLKISECEDFSKDTLSYSISNHNFEFISFFEKQLESAINILNFSFIDINIPQHCIWFMSKECWLDLLNKNTIKRSIRVPFVDIVKPNFYWMECSGSEFNYLELNNGQKFIAVITNTFENDPDSNIYAFISKIFLFN